ncbi:MAG TPA: alpha-L-fucosidase [Opitutaceae bacterium]|nr:alpha-L-fucosidase [Opitutaceae bacterium]
MKKIFLPTSATGDSPRARFRFNAAVLAVVALAAFPCAARAQTAPLPVEEPAVAGAANAPGANARTPRDTPEMVAAALKDIPAPPEGAFGESWESIEKNYRDPEWFRDGKFGIMMHWGIYSVPAHGSEWYVRYMYGGNADIMKWHTEHFGPPTKFGYKDFLPMFTAAKWDPDAWAALFKKAGAKYVLAPGEHHDGFSNWDSAINPYNSKNYGPHRDLDGELIAALERAGLKTGISDHSAFHFVFIPALAGSDQYDPKWADFYSVADRSEAARIKFMHDWVAKRIETIEKYRPDMLWFDMTTDHRWDPLKIRVAAYYFNRARQWGKEVGISAKAAAWVSGQIMDYEREGRAPLELTDWVWQPDDPITNKFGYVTEQKPYPADQFVWKIVENVSKNGNLLLNISPRADGTIPQEQQDVLLAIGKWLEVNGEAIYGSRPWIKYGEGPAADAAAAAMVAARAKGFAGRINGQNQGSDLVGGGGLPRKGYTPQDIRFTKHGDTLYATVMSWPADEALITSLATGQAPAGKIEKVELLGHAGALAFTQDAAGLHVKFPTEKPCDYAFALKITGLKLK